MAAVVVAEAAVVVDAADARNLSISTFLVGSRLAVVAIRLGAECGTHSKKQSGGYVNWPAAVFDVISSFFGNRRLRFSGNWMLAFEFFCHQASHWLLLYGNSYNG